LLSTDGETFELHDVLRLTATPEETLGHASVLGFHQLIASYYLEYASTGDVSSWLTNAIEAFHHAARSTNRHLIASVKPCFVEQLHVHGRTLSKELNDHAGAAEIFKLAVELEDGNDYSHHYWAYNTDWRAGDTALIEREYTRAVELNPTHAWWWSRWINFLITTGRMLDARREWSKASDELRNSDGWERGSVFRELHLWVARLLLHRGQLDFAARVIEDVPPTVRKEHVGFRALERWLIAMQEARRARGVFPLQIPPGDWWRLSPHLDFPPQVAGKALLQWNPARVEAIQDGVVTLVVGQKPAEEAALPTYGWIELPFDRFDAASLDERAEALRSGRFVELAFYGEEGILRIRVHPDRPWVDPDLPPLDPPDPQRYLKKGFPAS
jgi:tetratricopeptide (TPR) repeat protein